MLIWDEEKGEHLIRVVGQEKASVKSSDFSLVTSNRDNEISIKDSKDTLLRESKYHLHIRIFSKPTSLSPAAELSYTIWLGPEEIEPSAPEGYEWWENWEEK